MYFLYNVYKYVILIRVINAKYSTILTIFL